MNDASDRRREIHAILYVFTTTEAPETITRILGVNPTQTWNAGDLAGPPGSRRHKKRLGSQIASRSDRRRPDQAVMTLIDLFPDRAAFRRLPAGAEVQLTCAVYGYRERPGLYLSGTAMAALAEIGANLDVDTYDLSEVEDSA